MEYEKLLLDLLQKVSILEEKVAKLEDIVNTNKIDTKPVEKPERGSYTSMVKDYIKEQIYNAKNNGLDSITLISGDVQKAVGLKNRLPLICNSMYSVMRELNEFESIIVYAPPSGLSSTLEIKWILNKKEV